MAYFLYFIIPSYRKSHSRYAVVRVDAHEASHVRPGVYTHEASHEASNENLQ